MRGIVKAKEVKSKIEAGLPGAVVSVVDNAEEHAGHQSSGGHFSVYVKYSQFAGKSLVEQQRMVYALLSEEMKGPIHALALKTEE